MNISKITTTLKFFVQKHSFAILAILLFTAFTFYYMTPQFLHISSTTYGFGDNTAGPIWKNSLPGQPMLGGFENKTNYPFGESIYNPTGYSLILQTVPIWALSKAVGPIAGYNLFNFFGFIISALIMCGFVYTITRNKYIAILAGYAASFAPYYQMKVGGHPGYGYQALLIGLVWAFFNLLKHVKKKHAITLGVLTATCFYFDPYFSILAATCLTALGVAWLITSWLQVRKNPNKKPTFIRQLRMTGFSVLVTVILLIPLLFVAVSKSQEISSSVSAARGNVLLEAKACSILPYQYASPFVLHPVFSRIFGSSYKTNIDNINNHFPCGIGEDTIGISITILTLVGATLVIFAWEKLNKRKLGLSSILGFEPKLFVIGILTIGVAAMLMALPPAKLGFVPTPSEALLSITSTWRTLARFYVLINISGVILFSVALAYFAQNFKQHKKILRVLFIILFFMIFVEYQAFKPLAGNELSNYDYTKNPPTAYSWLSKQTDIKTIAEYPLEREGGESNAGAYYLSMQTTHQKNLFNSALSNSPQESIRSSLKDLADPQTVPVLRAFGTDTVVIHGLSKDIISRIPYLKVIYSAPQSAYNLLAYTPLVTDDNIVIAKIVNPPTVTTMLQLRGSEFPRNAGIIHSPVDWSYEALQDGHIDIASIDFGRTKHGSNRQPQNVCFAVKLSFPKDTDSLTILADGKPQTTLAITDVYQEVKVTARNGVMLHNKLGHNMQVKDLGCST